jgi:iron complex transport system substrate-binding protein
MNGQLGRGLALLLLALLHAAAAAAGIRVVDDRGVVVELAQPPQRIVSLLPSLTETVCALDACDRLVGVDRWSNWPEPVRGLPRLGGLDDVQVEALLRLRPDLVLAAVSHRTLARLEALGVRVVALRAERHADVQRVFTTVAALLGTPARGEQAWARVQQQLAQAAARMPPALHGATVYFEVASTPHAAGADSFIGQTLAALGLRNIVPPAMGPFPQINPEFVVRARPEVVVAVAREARRLAQRPGWAALPALREGRVCAYPEGPAWELLVRPGPRLGEAALALADCLAALPAPPPAARGPDLQTVNPR